jgi:mono/diheme cytochrome c family protein
MSKTVRLIFLVTTAMALSSCSFSLAGDITPPPGSELPYVKATQTIASDILYPLLPPDLVNGAQIYRHECIQCHGTRGMGDGLQADQLPVPAAALGLADFSNQYTPAEWYAVVTKGDMENYMPNFTAILTDRQRWDVVSYVMSLSTPEDMVHEGQILYQQNCVRCHGQDGKGNGPDAKSLSGIPADFTNQAFMAQISSSTLYQVITTGITPDMPAYKDALDDYGRQAVVAYLRSLTYVNPLPSSGAYPAPAANGTPTPSATSYPVPQPTQNPAVSPTSAFTTTTPIIGSVSVQLINGSGGDVPSDALVTLYGFDDMQNTYSETLSSGIDGVYTFTNITMPEGRAFLARVDYAAGTYGSDVAMVDPANPNLVLQTTVYDPTTDTSVLTTDRIHILFDFSDPQNINVVEVFIISNPSNQAVVPVRKDGTVVAFPLPQGYTNLQFQDGELGGRYVAVDQGFADTLTVNPGVGDYQVIFAFQMPYNRKLNFIQPMFLPTSAVVVMVPDNGVNVDSSMLQDGGTRDFQNTTYRMYNGNSLLAGSSLEFNLSGAPKTSASSTLFASNMQNLAIGLGIFGLTLTLGGLWLYRKNQRNNGLQTVPYANDIASPSTELDLNQENEETLMDAIISLDDQFHAGNLPKEAYLDRRAELKDKLRRLTQD